VCVISGGVLFILALIKYYFDTYKVEVVHVVVLLIVCVCFTVVVMQKILI